MHFTRDPIIETIVTPREGHRLVLRHTSQTGHEEFFVDMLEVVSFGTNIFYRSLDKPKPFILPADEYEVLEVREQRIALKAPAAAQKGIKIAGGKSKKEEKEEDEPKSTRRKRRTRKKGADGDKEKAEVEPKEEETKEYISVDKPSLIPPPPTLISDTISRYKEMTAIEELALEEELEPIAQESEPEQ